MRAKRGLAVVLVQGLREQSNGYVLSCTVESRKMARPEMRIAGLTSSSARSDTCYEGGVRAKRDK